MLGRRRGQCYDGWGANGEGQQQGIGGMGGKALDHFDDGVFVAC